MTVPNPAAPAWHISSRCSSQGCVEVAESPRAVLVRDSKEEDGDILTFDAAAWGTFIAGLRAGAL